MSFTLYLMPFIAALIGWVTNYIAVKMLFRPRRPVFGIQGLVPRRQREIAESIGEAVERDLISHEDVMRVLSNPDVQARLASLLGEKVDVLTSKLGEKNPMIGMFLQGELAVQVKNVLIAELGEVTPKILESLMQQLEEKLDFKEVVRRKIEGFDLGKLESIIYRISARELRSIELLGGVLGFLVGLGQVALILATGE